jgi:branched-chain amino acid transport system ATP-binding protein
MVLLETRQLMKHFGGIMAVNEISLSIGKGEILGMIGPNGSGKSTFVNLLTGIYAPDKGRTLFKDRDITALPVHRITEIGISRTFQNLRIFQNISVMTNILIGRHSQIKNSLWDVYLRPLSAWKREKAAREKAMEFLELAHLADRRNELAKNLPYGEQRLLEICRALASEPELLLLDEPCAGMNPVEMDTLAEFIERIKASGTTVFIIEHNMRFIMSIAERIVVLNMGKKFKEGSPLEIQSDSGVQSIYLGEEEDADA